MTAPTKAQLAWLRLIQQGKVHTWDTNLRGRLYCRGSRSYSTSAMASNLRDAGWIDLAPALNPDRTLSVTLTDAGKAALA